MNVAFLWLSAAWTFLAGPDLLAAQNGTVGLVDEKALDERVDALMEKYHVPGLAMAVLKGNETWAKGYGFSTLPSAPVTTDTLFAIGSNTKSMIGYLWALLAAESGSPLEYLNTPLWILLKDIPEAQDTFVFATKQHTKQLTPLDLLTHRTGYAGRVEINAYADEPEDTVKLLRHYPLGGDGKEEDGYFTPGGTILGFRDKFRYSNQMYIAAGLALEYLGNATLPELLQRYIWEPAGMNTTRLGYPFEEGLGEDDVELDIATQYWYNNDTETYEVRADRPILPVGAAGGVLTSVADWAKYLHFIKSKETTAPLSVGEAMFVMAPHFLQGPYMLGSRTTPPGLLVGPEPYGLGWISNIVNGVECWAHNGGVGTSMSEMWVCPSIDFAVCVAFAGYGGKGNVPGILTPEAVFRATKTESRDDMPDLDARWDAVDAAAEAALAGCKTALFPNATGEGRTLGMKKLEGTYAHPSLMPFNLTRVCGEESHVEAEGSPAHITRDEEGCFLRAGPIITPGTLFAGELEHAEDNNYVVWPYDADLDTYRRPQRLCLPAYFESSDETSKSLTMRLIVSTEGEADLVALSKVA